MQTVSPSGVHRLNEGQQEKGGNMMARKATAVAVLILFVAGLVGCGTKTYYKITDSATGNTYYAKKVKMKKDGQVIFDSAREGSKMKLRSASVQNISKEDFKQAISATAPVQRVPAQDTPEKPDSDPGTTSEKPAADQP
jgi:hypothetical protein